MLLMNARSKTVVLSSRFHYELVHEGFALLTLGHSAFANLISSRNVYPLGSFDATVNSYRQDVLDELPQV